MKFNGKLVLAVAALALMVKISPLSVMAETDGTEDISGNALELQMEAVTESGLAPITGYCGDESENEGKNVTYAITDSDGDGIYDLLNIEGEGRMRDYLWSDIKPWSQQDDNNGIKIKKIIIKKGVTSVGAYAFYQSGPYGVLEEVTIPEGATIGEGAFRDCDLLSEVTIPEGATIGEDAFHGCYSLSEVTIPKGATIGSCAFCGCRSLSKVTILEGVATIGEMAFSGCSSLKEVIIPIGVKTIEQLAFARCSSLKEVIIPEGVTTIGGGAFLNCSSLSEVTIPKGVTTIERETFSFCSSLNKVVIPEGVTTIGGGAFYYCSSLKEVIIPIGVKTIEQFAFSGCSSLKEVIIPIGVKTIEWFAFASCSSLKEVIIPEGVTTIGNGAFSRCSLLKEMTIPDSIISIGNEGGIRHQIMFICNEDIPVETQIRGSYGTSVVKFKINNRYELDKENITILEIVAEPTASIEIPDTLNNRPVVFVPKEYRNLVSEKGHTHKYDEDGFCSICDKEYVQTSSSTIPTGPDTWRDKTGIEGFVYRLYNVALIRDAEDAGLSDWTNRLDTKKESAAEVARGFFFSDEFLNRDYNNEQYVELLYRTMFGRDSDEAGKAYWLNCLENGASREYVYHGFAESQEFTGLCEGFGVNRGSVSLGQYRDQNIEATGFVARLYTKMLGRGFDDDGIEYWCKEYITGKKSIEDIAADGFLHSPEFTAQDLSDKEFVIRMYGTFLNREPDEAGLNDWVGRLERGEVTRDGLVYGFTNSPEFGKLKKEYNLP